MSSQISLYLAVALLGGAVFAIENGHRIEIAPQAQAATAIDLPSCRDVAYRKAMQRVLMLEGGFVASPTAVERTGAQLCVREPVR